MSREVRISFGLFILSFLLLVSCVSEPPTREYLTPTPPEEGQIMAPPPFDVSPTMTNIWEMGYLKYGVPIAVPYSTVVGAGREFEGMIPDLADMMAQQLGYPTLTQLQRWSSMPSDLTENRIHMIIGGSIKNPDFEDLTFVKIGERGYCLLANANDDRFEELEDILESGVIVIVADATDGEYLVTTEYPEIEVRSESVVEPASIIAYVLDGEADVALIYAATTPLILDTYPDLKAFPTDCLKNPLWSTPWGISMRADDPAFYQYVEDVINNLQEIGWLEERWEAWSDIDRMREISPFNE